jgi:SAM-dependent methyltransferase
VQATPPDCKSPCRSYEEVVEACSNLYRPFGQFPTRYARGKLLHDPVYRQLAASAPLGGPVLDLGCGRGQTVFLLELLHPGNSYVGYDWDEKKVEMASDCATRLPGAHHLAFHSGDLREQDLPLSRSILLLDVLHYFSLEDQDALLERIVEALEPGGRLYLRDVDAHAGWRARVNVLQERVGRWFGLNRGTTLRFRPMNEIASRLESLGLETRWTTSWNGTPLANVLIEGVTAK